MERDIENKADITALIEHFYTIVLTDPMLSDIFIRAKFDLESHAPVMVSFWESILFGQHNYKGNPMLKHIEMNRTIPLHAEHFQRWLDVWERTVNDMFTGPIADEAISRAKSIGGLMQFKIEQQNKLS